MSRVLIPYLFMIVTLLSACSVMGVSEWNAYQVFVEAKDTSGQLIEEARVTSAADKTEKTKTPGVFSLLYLKTGIHVVTISAPDKQTKQIKLTLPADHEKIMSVILIDK